MELTSIDDIIIMMIILIVIAAICVIGVRSDKKIKERMKNSRYGNGYYRRDENS